MISTRSLVLAALSWLTLSAAPSFAEESQPGARMRAAAQALIASLDERRRARLVLAFTDAQRTDWHYTPRSRPGLTFADLDAAQREALTRLLKSALSAVGHRKVVNIIELELVLKEIEFALSFLRDPEKYAIVVFATPDAVSPWGWRFEGHHLSLNFTVRGDAAVATTPSFFGANPAEVKKGPKQGLRALAAEEDEARKLLTMLDAGQRRTTIVDARTYGDIITAAKDQVAPLDNRGIEARAMTEPQKAQLRKLIEVYADCFEPQLRAARQGQAALLPCAGREIPHRVRRVAERRQPRAHGVARLRGRLRARPAARAPRDAPALKTGDRPQASEPGSVP